MICGNKDCEFFGSSKKITYSGDIEDADFYCKWCGWPAVREGEEDE